MLRFKKKIKIADVGITAIAGIFSVCAMYYAVYKFGMYEAGEELILNAFYVACLTMIGLYFFNRMTGHLRPACNLSFPLGPAATDADILLCPQELEDLHQTRPVDDIYCGCDYCRTLQLRLRY